MTSDELAIKAIDAINEVGIPCMVTGSFARNLYAMPRSTGDIDVVVESPFFNPLKVARLLGPDFLVDPQVYFETITGTTRFVVRHSHSPFAVEFFLLSDDAHDHERFRRRKVSVATAEDVIIAKLRWSDRGRRPKDRADAKDVMTVQVERLDWPYIEKWCAQHGTLGLLNELRRELGAV